MEGGGRQSQEDAASADHSRRGYQLAHDYLVPSLRSWLERRQRESRAGRAQLLLSERQSAWSARPENRNLPTWWEHWEIRRRTSSSHWTQGERTMLARAWTVHGRQLLGLCLLLAMLLVGLQAVRNMMHEQQQKLVGESLVQRLLVAPISETPSLVRELRPYERWAKPILRSELQASPSDSPRALRALLALSDGEHELADRLQAAWLRAQPGEFAVIRDVLATSGALADVGAREALWALAGSPTDSETAFRAATALAHCAPQDARWTRIAGQTADALLERNNVHLSGWVDLLRPVKDHLQDRLLQRLSLATQNTDITRISDVLAEYVDDAPSLVTLLAEAPPTQFPTFLKALQDRTGAAQTIREQMQAAAQVFDPTQAALASDQADPATPAPSETLVTQLQRALGDIHDAFAYCQALPLERLTEIDQGLAACGYSIHKIRPYRRNDTTLAAVVWRIDTNAPRWRIGLTEQEVQQWAEQAVSESYYLRNAAGYAAGPQGETRYAAVMHQTHSLDEATDYRLNIPDDRVDDVMKELLKGSFSFPVSMQSFLDHQGQLRMCVVSRKSGAARYWRYDAAEDNMLRKYVYDRLTQTDISIHNAPPSLSAREVYLARLDDLNQQVREQTRWEVNQFAQEQSPPPTAAVDRILGAGGLVADTFAICQTLAIDEFQDVNRQLGAAGYRPDRFRPITVQDQVLCSALWLRDGLQSDVRWNLTLEQLAEADRENQQQRGLQPIDARAYSGADGTVRAAVVWKEKTPNDPPVRRVTLVPFEKHQANVDSAARQRIFPKTVQYGRLPDGALWVAQVWQSVQGSYQQRTVINPIQFDNYLKNYAPTDITLYHRGASEKANLFAGAIFLEKSSLSAKVLLQLNPEKHLEQMRQLAERGWRPETLTIAAEPKDQTLLAGSVWRRKLPASLFQRAVARRYSGDLEGAVSDLNDLIDNRG